MSNGTQKYFELWSNKMQTRGKSSRTIITRMMTITVTTTVNNHSDNLNLSCCSLNKCVLKSITFHFSNH
jgi:hypothetical protein